MMKGATTTPAMTTSWPIGFHARSWGELVRVTSLDGVNLVELKPDRLARKSDVHLYEFDGSRFSINDRVARDIRCMTVERDIGVQIHLPIERLIDRRDDAGLCQALLEHHDLILARYEMLGELFLRHGLGSVITTHGPTFEFDGARICSPEEAIENGALLFARLDRLMRERDYAFRVGIENVVAPKSTGSSAVGFKPRHIDSLIGNCRHIGITVDSGHRRLNNLMSIRLLASYGRIVNIHFHSNSGVPNDTDYKDDEHILATPENLPHFRRYIKSIRRGGIPIVLEIDDLARLTDEELSSYVIGLRMMIENP